MIHTLSLAYIHTQHTQTLSHTGLKPPVLLFMQSKDRAKDLYRELVYDGINVDVIHAERTQQQREDIIRYTLCMMRKIMHFYVLKYLSLKMKYALSLHLNLRFHIFQTVSCG